MRVATPYFITAITVRHLDSMSRHRMLHVSSIETIQLQVQYAAELEHSFAGLGPNSPELLDLKLCLGQTCS